MYDFVTHFVKHNANEDLAAQALLNIIRSEELKGSNTYINGGYRCICFSDKPVGGSFQGLFDKYGSPVYARFGISVHKNTLFAAGGRPVIYQPEAEYVDLPDSHKWRHVTYNPPRRDFTWEREWRIREDTLLLRSVNAFIVVPGNKAEWFADQLDVLRQANTQIYIPAIWSFD